MTLRFKQDSSIFGIDDVYTFIITYFFSDIRKSDGQKGENTVLIYHDLVDCQIFFTNAYILTRNILAVDTIAV